jgi:hypothetical protein
MELRVSTTEDELVLRSGGGGGGAGVLRNGLRITGIGIGAKLIEA